MLDRVTRPAGEALAAGEVVEQQGVLRMSLDQLASAIGRLGVLACPYEPDGWELWAPLNPLYQAGEYAEVADRLRPVVEANPQYGSLVYNLACVESLAGRPTDAIDHLRQAIATSDRWREYARGDSDFDAIRDEPAFQELVAERAEARG